MRIPLEGATGITIVVVAAEEMVIESSDYVMQAPMMDVALMEATLIDKSSGNCKSPRGGE